MTILPAGLDGQFWSCAIGAAACAAVVFTGPSEFGPAWSVWAIAAAGVCLLAGAMRIALPESAPVTNRILGLPLLAAASLPAVGLWLLRPKLTFDTREDVSLLLFAALMTLWFLVFGLRMIVTGKGITDRTPDPSPPER